MTVARFQIFYVGVLLLSILGGLPNLCLDLRKRRRDWKSYVTFTWMGQKWIGFFMYVTIPVSWMVWEWSAVHKRFCPLMIGQFFLAFFVQDIVSTFPILAKTGRLLVEEFLDLEFDRMF